MDTATSEAMAIFYKMKGEYDRKLRKIKKAVLDKDNLTLEEKRDLFKAQRPKCLVCKRPVGMIFQSENSRLVGMCGDTTNPCKFNITITKGKIVYLPNYVAKLRKEHKHFITKIMEIKYNLLFKFSTEDESVSEFEREKNDYEKNAVLFDNYKTQLLEITELLSKQDRIALTDLQIFEFIKEMKELIQEGISTQNPQLLRDAVEIYVARVMDVIRENQSLKYNYQAIEVDGHTGESILIQKPYTIGDLEKVVGDDFKVESLVLKK